MRKIEAKYLNSLSSMSYRRWIWMRVHIESIFPHLHPTLILRHKIFSPLVCTLWAKISELQVRDSFFCWMCTSLVQNRMLVCTPCVTNAFESTSREVHRIYTEIDFSRSQLQQTPGIYVEHRFNCKEQNEEQRKLAQLLNGRDREGVVIKPVGRSPERCALQ